MKYLIILLLPLAIACSGSSSVEEAKAIDAITDSLQQEHTKEVHKNAGPTPKGAY